MGTVEISFLFFFLAITCPIGLWAARKSRKTGTDYFLASRSVSPYLLALSGTASLYSGFMFAGYMGMAYSNGTAVIYMSLGMMMGYFSCYAFVTSRLQKLNVGGWALSLGELVTFCYGENRVWLRRFIGLVTIFFLTFYAAAQLKTGGKALNVALDYSPLVGMALSVGVILFYCWSGGIRASIWTDAVQAVLMLSSVIMIVMLTVAEAGGVAAFWQKFLATSSVGGVETVSFFPQNLSIGGWSGLLFFLAGYVATGFCVMGQPHVLIRAMATQGVDAKKFIRASLLFALSFEFVFVLAGLCTRVVLQDVTQFDPEQALFLSARHMLPAVAVGFLLAGAFSAALSTADSQILSCSASVMRDLAEPPSGSLWGAKLGTLGVTLMAALLSYFGSDNVFSLVVFAYTGLGVSIGGLLVLRFFHANISEVGSIIVASLGLITVIAWDRMGMTTYMPTSIPGFAVFFGSYFLLAPWFRVPGHHNFKKIV